MANSASLRKKQELLYFIEQEIAHEPAIQGVIAIGSVAGGSAREDSDIDGILFLDPFDLYIVPAEFKWSPKDHSFHSIFEGSKDEAWLQFDFARLDLARWADASFEWPEARRAELSEGWLAFDRSGKSAELIKNRTNYSDAIRIAKLDDAITMLDQLLRNDHPQLGDQSGLLIVHDCLQAAYEYLVQGLFAYNRRWRPWRNREMSWLLALPWLPDGFANRIKGAMAAPTLDQAGYAARAGNLSALFQDLTTRCTADGLYGGNVVREAFMRSHDEPGRAWNMDDWNQKHLERRGSA